VLNSLRNRHTGFTSNRLVFGRELNTPLSLLAENRSEFEIEPMKENEFDAKAYELYKNLKHITRKVRIQAERDFCYAQKYHDKNLKGPFFEQGEEAFVLINCPTHKFGPRWVGPYKISRKINDHLYCLDLPNGEKKIFNICKLKRYVRNRYSPDPKTSLSNEKAGENGVKVQAPSCTDRRRASSESDSESDEEIEVHIKRAPIYKPAASTKTGTRLANSKSTRSAAAENCSTPRSRGLPSAPDAEIDQGPKPQFSSPSPVRSAPNPEITSERELSDSSAAFFTPATTKTTRRQSASSNETGDCTIQAGNTLFQDLDNSESNSAASLSPVNVENCSPPEQERRYNTRRAAERRKPERLGYESVSKLSMVNDILQLLKEQL
jgi:hypothetical protein